MRGKKAKRLRKETEFNPKEGRDYSHLPKGFREIKGQKYPLIQIINTIGSARAKYKKAKTA